MVRSSHVAVASRRLPTARARIQLISLAYISTTRTHTFLSGDIISAPAHLASVGRGDQSPIGRQLTHVRYRWLLRSGAGRELFKQTGRQRQQRHLSARAQRWFSGQLSAGVAARSYGSTWPPQARF